MSSTKEPVRSTKERGAFTYENIIAPRTPHIYLADGMSLVRGAGAPHMVAAYGYTGKTLLMQGMFVALAAGLPVWGAYPCRPTKVVHIDYEQGETATFDRYERFFRGMQPDPEFLRCNLTGVVMPQELSLKSAHTSRWKELMAGQDFMLVDSLRAAMPDVDENDSKIRSGLDLLANLSAVTGCRSIVIHHTRKTDGDENPERAIRGSSSIFDACDTVFYLSAKKKNGPVKVKNVKARSHGFGMADLTVQVVGGPGEPMRVAMLAGGPDAPVELLSASTQRAFDILKASPIPISTNKLRLAAGLSHEMLERVKKELGARLIETTGPRNSVLLSLR